ncbi:MULTISPECIES: hypothetical protein [Methylomonas]|uniref:Lipoprotein n=1 Tax=Methylomonas koyamae TaxID=702114 RepID=A0A177P457_9GAMM|nr:hypothetical protein [Methylomonas koyamae]OAI25056.1 hypothetical protein A1355_19995 [Methylomonas koyamae]
MKLVHALHTLLVLTLIGCSSTHTLQPSAPIDYHADASVTANLDVGSKIQGEAHSTQILWFITLGPNKFADGVNFTANGTDPISQVFRFDPFFAVKSAAAYDAVSQANADVIVGPRYIIEIDDYFIFSKTKATVNGYKGTIKKFNNSFHFDPSKLVR